MFVKKNKESCGERLDFFLGENENDRWFHTFF